MTMPVKLLRTYIRGLPRVEALDTLRMVHAYQVGGPFTKPQSAQRAIAALRSEAGLTGPRGGSDMDALAAMRIANERARARGELWEQRLESSRYGSASADSGERAQAAQGGAA